MQRFGELLDSLVFQPARNEKLRLIVHYLQTAPDPDRGYALAALTGALDLPNAKPAVLRALGAAQTDEVLFALSYDYVGDLAEALALVWRGDAKGDPPTLSEVVKSLQSASVREVPELITGFLNRLDSTGRWGLLKLITGELRVGVSARLAKTALALFGAVELDEVEELWHGREPPYADLFLWLTRQAERPHPLNLAFRPFMLAHPLDEAEIAQLPAADFRAEWKWDGIRVQAAHEGSLRRLYTRTGDDISRTFPDILDALDDEGVIDGELLVIRDGKVAPFADLQQRLNRKSVDAKLMAQFPAAIRAYDILQEGDDDLRALPLTERRKRLEAFVARQASPRIDLSPMQPFVSWAELTALRADPPPGDPQIAEGLMLKRWDSEYVAGRPKGPWFKWKRDPFLVDAVLMYAQRGHGKRSSYYSDYTFGVWDEGKLTPVGKAYFGFTDEELLQIDKFVRDNTIERFGPVRSVRAEPHHGLVFEVAFEGLQRSTRHKSGVAMRFPRISRIRWDKPPGEADEIDALERLLVQMEQR
jgi:DNA ligase 1